MKCKRPLTIGSKVWINDQTDTSQAVGYPSDEQPTRYQKKLANIEPTTSIHLDQGRWYLAVANQVGQQRRIQLMKDLLLRLIRQQTAPEWRAMCCELLI